MSICSCGYNALIGQDKCRLCQSIDKQFEGKIDDIIPICDICKTECEYVWITKDGKTTCFKCIEVIA